jgi:hypothetical protein
MEFHYLPTLADFKASVRLHNRQNLSRIVSGIFLIWVMPTIAALILIHFLYLTLTTTFRYAPGSSFTFLCLFYCLLLPVFHQRKIRKQYRLLYPPAIEVTGVDVDINNDYIRIAMPGAQEGKYFWNTITKSVRDSSVTMFYADESRYILVPTHSLSLDQKAEFDSIVTRNLGRQEK